MSQLKIGEVAAAADVTVQAVRYYERRGLLPRSKRSTGNYRLYDDDTVRRVRLIKQAQDLGFTLAEVTELLALRDLSAGGGDVRRVAVKQIAHMQSKITMLERMIADLQGLVDACHGDSSGQCPILHQLEEPRQRRAPAASRTRRSRS